MNIYRILRRSFQVSKEWDKRLDSIVSRYPDGRELIELNKRKKSLGVSGLGTLLFGEIFNLNTDPEVVYVNTAFNTYSAYVDCYIDRTFKKSDKKGEHPELSELLDDIVGFLESGRTKNHILLEVEPLIGYIRNSVLSRDCESLDLLVEYGRNYANSVKNEFIANNPEDRMYARIKLGSVYGDIVSCFLDVFSENRLTSNQRDAIKIYAACSTLHDDFIDIFEDGDDGYIIDSNKKNIIDNISRLYIHRQKTKALFYNGKKIIDDPVEQDGYQQMFNVLMHVGDIFLVKKGGCYLAQKIRSSIEYKKRDIYDIKEKVV